MNFIDRFSGIISSINQWVGRVLCVFTFAIAAITGIEVVLRYVFNRPTLWGTPISTLLFGVVSVMGGGWALVHNEHINMDIFHSRLSPQRKARVDLVTSLFFFFFCGVMFWYGSDGAWIAIRRWEHYGAVFNPIIWPFKLLIPLAALLIILQGVAKFLHDLRLARSRKETKMWLREQ